MMQKSDFQIPMLGAKLSLCDNKELLSIIGNCIRENNRLLVLSGNIQAFNLICKYSWLRGFFHRADIVRIDGDGVRLGAKILGYDPPSRTTWADFAWELAGKAEKTNWEVFFLGGKPGVAKKAAVRLLEKFPDLKIVGTNHGYFDKSSGSLDTKNILANVNKVSPDILIVGFGMPLQERWLLETLDDIEATVIMTGGAVFDYISGELTRGPKWMTDHGLEWLARLIIEPRRLWKRYLVGNPLYMWRILKQKFGLLKF